MGEDMKLFKKWMGVFFSVVILVGMVGCVAPQQSANVSHIKDKTIDASHPRALLVLASSQLLDKLVMTNVRFGSVGNFQRTEVSMQNLSKQKLNLEYKIEWQDKDGFTINSNPAWHRFSLAPKQIQNFQSVGKDPAAYQIQVVVRLPGDFFMDSQKEKDQKND